MGSSQALRFAPSPNGRLHLGHAYCAMLNLKLARSLGATMLLRIEDIDRQRCTPQNESAMLRDLEWIGFEWDREPIRQSQRMDAYGEALAQLRDREMLYPSYLSRSEIRAIVNTRPDWPSDPDGAPLYPGNERDFHFQNQGNEHALGREKGKYEQAKWRLDMTSAIQSAGDTLGWHEWCPHTGKIENQNVRPQDWGDVILSRQDTPTSYHVSCVVDDADQRVSHVVRGLDLFQATSVHRLLQVMLHMEAPLYHHHRLILGADGRKLSKSENATALCDLRDAGAAREEVLERIGLPEMA